MQLVREPLDVFERKQSVIALYDLRDHYSPLARPQLPLLAVQRECTCSSSL